MHRLAQNLTVAAVAALVVASAAPTPASAQSAPVYVFDDRAPTPDEIRTIFNRQKRMSPTRGLTRSIQFKPSQPAPAQQSSADVASRATPSAGIAAPIEFELDSARIRADYRPHLESFASVLRDDPDMRLVVIGHADAKGDAGYNLNLSRRRAEAVKSALVRDFGIGSERIAILGRGESEPLYSNGQDPRNRRVEFFPN